MNLGLSGRLTAAFIRSPLTPLSLAFCVELTYPTPEAVSNGMMLLPSKVYSSLLAVVAGLASQKSPEYAVMIFVGNAVVCSICSVMMREELRRLRP